LCGGKLWQGLNAFHMIALGMVLSAFQEWAKQNKQSKRLKIA
jgi:hypothetical protein